MAGGEDGAPGKEENKAEGPWPHFLLLTPGQRALLCERDRSRRMRSSGNDERSCWKRMRKRMLWEFGGVYRDENAGEKEGKAVWWDEPFGGGRN